MMRYYMQSESGYILSVGTGESGTEITETRYNEILSAIRSKQTGTETTDYRLKEDLTWEEYEVEPPEENPDIDDAEAFDIIFGGAE